MAALGRTWPHKLISKALKFSSLELSILAKVLIPNEVQLEEDEKINVFKNKNIDATKHNKTNPSTHKEQNKFVLEEALIEEEEENKVICVKKKRMIKDTKTELHEII